MTDDELRQAILDELEAHRTDGSGGTPLALSDVNIAERLGCEFEQLNRVLGSLVDDGKVHGKPRGLRVGEAEMDLDYVRLFADPLPKPDPRELD